MFLSRFSAFLDIILYMFSFQNRYLHAKSNIVLADVIGENDCGIDPDVLQLQCSVVYSGNFVPVLLWQNSGEHVMIGTNVSTSIQDETNHITVSTLTVIANMGLNDTYFTCQVVGSQSVGVVPESKTEKITVHCE